MEKAISARPGQQEGSGGSGADHPARRSAFEKIVPLRSWTAMPDEAARHVGRWRADGLHQLARVYLACCKASSLRRTLNASMLQDLAVEFRLEDLGSRRRVQCALGLLQSWDLIRWESRPRLLRLGRSRILIAGKHYDFPELPQDYLERRADVVSVARREELRRRRTSQNRQPTTERARREWQGRRAALREIWEPIAGDAVKHLENVWHHVAALMEDQGIDPIGASKYLRRLAAVIRSRPTELRAVKCPMRFAKSRERVTEYIRRNRSELPHLERPRT